MNHKFKVGDIVRCISNKSLDKYCTNKIGKIIAIDNYNHPHIVEFSENIKGHCGGYGIGKSGYCWRFEEDEIKLYREPILKLFLKEKQNEI